MIYPIPAGTFADTKPAKPQPKKEEELHCPVCGSTDIEDVSTYQGNGIFGPGAASWKTFDVRCCRDCGVLFKPVKKKPIVPIEPGLGN